MTREEAEKYIKFKMCKDCGVSLGGGKCSDNCRVIEAIKILEQEPVDKIRAEIEQNAYPIVHGVNNHEKGMTLYGILQIINKYKKLWSDTQEV